jgi:hypothetical protein
MRFEPDGLLQLALFHFRQLISEMSPMKAGMATYAPLLDVGAREARADRVTSHHKNVPVEKARLSPEPD